MRDTPARYGKVTRVLHWGIGALIVWQLVAMIMKVTLEKSPLVSFFVGSHQKVGTVLAVLIVLRVIWAWRNRNNRPPHGGGFVGLAARAGHVVLYAVMLIVPVSALIRAWGSDRSFAPFGFEIFAAKEPPVEWAMAVGGALHGELGWALLALILGHVAMVFVHHRLWRDDTLSRMAGR